MLERPAAEAAVCKPDQQWTGKHSGKKTKGAAETQHRNKKQARNMSNRKIKSKCKCKSKVNGKGRYVRKASW